MIIITSVFVIMYICSIFVVTNKPCEAGSQYYICFSSILYHVHAVVTLISGLLIYLLS